MSILEKTPRAHKGCRRFP